MLTPTNSPKRSTVSSPLQPDESRQFTIIIFIVFIDLIQAVQARICMSVLCYISSMDVSLVCNYMSGISDSVHNIDACPTSIMYSREPDYFVCN